MSKRVRMTQRKRHGADESIPYPGNVNQPDRTDPDWDKYQTFEQSVNHELPDMRHQWEDNPRDEIGFGIPEPWGLVPEVPAAPKAASVRIAANKSVKLAVLLLGEKTPEEVIEAQARDFMGMPGSVMDRTLARFASTQELYAADDDEEGDDEEGDDEEEEVKKDEEKVDEDEAKAEEAKADAAKAEAKKAAEDKAEDKAKDKAEDKVNEEVPPKEAARRKAVGELDIELSPAVDTGLEDEVEVDEELEGLLDETPVLVEDELEALAAAEKTATAKKGIRSLGGQPKVAGESGPVTLDNLWKSAPDVSEVFGS